MVEKKHLFQFGEKSKKKEFRLEQITDIIGFRIILKNVLMIVTKLLVFFIKNGIAYQENLKIIFLLQKLMVINLFILL